jgi:thiamine-phosphate pyrophosphorylase
MLRGYYAVVGDGDGAPEALGDLAQKLVGAGACAVQLRLKAAPAGVLVRAVAALREAIGSGSIPILVNDRIDVALAAGADGVHLGQEDLPLADALRVRAACGRPDLLVGISTHNLDQIRAATAGGADYLGFGPVFATTTKAKPDPVCGLDGLAAAVTAAGVVPVVAIGGITPARMADVAATGAAAACVLAAVNRASDPAAAARAVTAAWRSWAHAGGRAYNRPA